MGTHLRPIISFFTRRVHKALQYKRKSRRDKLLSKVYENPSFLSVEQTVSFFLLFRPLSITPYPRHRNLPDQYLRTDQVDVLKSSSSFGERECSGGRSGDRCQEREDGGF